MDTKLKKSVTVTGKGPEGFFEPARNYHHDPGVVKQVEKAAETIKRIGLPGQKKK